MVVATAAAVVVAVYWMPVKSLRLSFAYCCQWKQLVVLVPDIVAVAVERTIGVAVAWVVFD